MRLSRAYDDCGWRDDSLRSEDGREEREVAVEGERDWEDLMNT